MEPFTVKYPLFIMFEIPRFKPWLWLNFCVLFDLPTANNVGMLVNSNDSKRALQSYTELPQEAGRPSSQHEGCFGVSPSLSLFLLSASLPISHYNRVGARMKIKDARDGGKEQQLKLEPLSRVEEGRKA